MAVSTASPAPGARVRSPIPSLLQLELRAGLRAPALRFYSIVALIGGWAAGGAPGHGAALSAYQAGEASWRYLGLASILWMALAAVRETSMRTEVLVYSKPQSNESLVLLRFVGTAAQIAGALSAVFLGAVLHRLLMGSTVGLAAYLVQYIRAAGTIFFAAAFSYSMALLAGTPLAGAVVALVWMLLLAGQSYLPKAFYPAFAQNELSFVLFSIALLAVAAQFHRLRRRGSQRAGIYIRVAAPLGLLLGAWGIWIAVRDGNDPLLRTQVGLDYVSSQTLTKGMLIPGFLWPDQHGVQTSLSDFPDRILVVALWSPDDVESIATLEELDHVQSKYGSRGVQVLAVCITEDTATARTFALGEALPFPILQDWGTHNAARPTDLSPTTTSYLAEELPLIAVTDRRRRVQDILTSDQALSASDIEAAVDNRLKQEPE